MSTVSLVICVWNRRDDLRENLHAIGRQTLPPLEVIVVDNASEDGTPEMVREEFPDVRLIRMPHSGYGACETFNIGFATARGEYVGILMMRNSPPPPASPAPGNRTLTWPYIPRRPP